MTLIDDRARPIPDPYVSLADDEPLPADGAVLVSLERWRTERDRLIGRGPPVGVRLRSSQLAREVAGELAHLALVALELPKFRDGRAFSAARELRERFGFADEVRAVGHILPDQYAFLIRSGVTTVELPANADLVPWQRALSEISIAYQVSPGAAGPAALPGGRRRLVPGATP